ncbi:undecaprenyl-phosphate alpha-N-acetylglucosaminyl 1-phosphate transferase [Parashewanella curva]|uniref:Undecaprenyl-phosphate alpha-N-acetylglucosaminyl 1-phosphate transferase n=1 Tax=Parashewanella curva TaxID=2338552 RepID=A0A3L8PY72_9GAMM|nr:UDP-N-acetylglucosamine--undecaprenyl-phosphate N-acetylglucosaminephosphotransferase [Parashewanella curva]RLV60397.1 undecaprenyl-phosphate alpha-N-acetylglucosaminyl 1-phosphate transferase [Parashewanella curva]
MEYFLAFMGSFLFTLCGVAALKPLAQKMGLVDIPNDRKLHVGDTPLIGGAAIFLGVLFASAIIMPLSRTFNLYLLSASLILILGILDDKCDLSVRSRLLVQVFVASILIFGANFYLSTFGFIFHFFEFKLGYIGTVVTVVAVIGAINAFNMVDGIDGLAGALSLVTFGSLSLLLYKAGNHWFILAFLFIPAILAYLSFNLRWPFKNVTKVFMGDAGSMLIGLSVVWLLVIGVESENRAFSPVTALYLIAIPLMDMAAIMYRRMKKGQSPFKPDRDHLHHIFERAGFSRRQTLVRIFLGAIVIALIGLIGEALHVPESIMFVLFVTIFVFYNWALMHVWQLLKRFRKD